ncbi:MAG: DNA polymerase III subunit gamma/tau [Proteobacteria bacterium]|nr:DNA polymerase III subunit gamma/tau [Pseudomonadota bacterium]
MAHMALARKYRPRHFGEMVGQPHVVQALGNALRSQRLHHAYLFTGTRGIGKTTISRILAKSLNCVGADGTGGITDTPCGVCHVCQQIDDGRFADYIELDAASNRGVDDIQSVLEQALYKPVDGRLKVLMVDEVHMLSSTAFNAMLKTLEEPPDYLKFVLATTDPQKVPVTVLSRCLQFNLRPMPPATIAQHLQGLLQHEAVAAEAGALALLGRAARGSMRDALSLTDQAIAHGNGELTEAAVRDMLGLVDETWGVQLLQALAAGDGAAVVQQVDTLRELGQSAQAVLDVLAERLHGVALLQLADAAPESADPTMADLAQALGADETQLLYSLCLQGRQDLTWSPDEYAGLNMVLLRFLAFGGGSKKKTPALVQAPSEAPPPQATAKPEPAVAAAPQAIATPEPAVQAAPQPTTPAPVAVGDPDGHEAWCALVETLLQSGSVAALARELAIRSQWLGVQGEGEGRRWCLQVEQPALAEEGPTRRLEQALAQAGHPVKLIVSVGEVLDGVAQRHQRQQAAQQQQALQTLTHDPDVQHVMQAFGGTIVPGSLVLPGQLSNSKAQ